MPASGEYLRRKDAGASWFPGLVPADAAGLVPPS